MKKAAWWVLAGLWGWVSVTAALGQGTWSTTTLPLPRDELAATTVGNYALFGGGWGPSSPSTRVDLLNAGTGQWSAASLSQARYWLAATTVGNLALFAGGLTNSAYTDRVDIFNAGTGQWTTASLSQPEAFPAATTVGNYALFAGGQGGNISCVDIYNASNGQWTTTTLSQGRCSMAATTVGNYALFAGGGTGGGFSDRVDIFNSSTGQWTTATLSKARQDLAATSLGGYALFGGGYYYDSYGYSAYGNQVDLFDASTGQWTTSTLFTARCSLVATTVSGDALFAGGDGASGSSAAVDIFAPEPATLSILFVGMRLTAIARCRRSARCEA